ncbi:hypothetical protein VTK73DRAFT_6936 [Phialemonium thermophilum]|uniref:2,5-diamino-6-ribosylamino-4(3H)-pyrimidinone 5'-phosphate reductase n=1 Tax=Phialemonium thermophilum TaxID=223376 RepID=A0ABR3XUK0_9PEZI
MDSKGLYALPAEVPRLEPHLPPLHGGLATPRSLPFVTLTFATSLDSALALAPGIRTSLSGPKSAAMTHYLRSRHDGILIGVGTAQADDPGLNCRLQNQAASTQAASAPGLLISADGGPRRHHQPRPVILDPRARWPVPENSRVLRLAREGAGLAPFVVTGLTDPEKIPGGQRETLERHGGKYIPVKPRGLAETGESYILGWEEVFRALKEEGLDSIMVEGGGRVINSLLEAPHNALVDSVIVTVAPTWLGQGGVVVSPRRSDPSAAAVRLVNVTWHPLGEDIVMCGRIPR